MLANGSALVLDPLSPVSLGHRTKGLGQRTKGDKYRVLHTAHQENAELSAQGVPQIRVLVVDLLGAAPHGAAAGIQTSRGAVADHAVNAVPSPTSTFTRLPRAGGRLSSKLSATKPVVPVSMISPILMVISSFARWSLVISSGNRCVIATVAKQSPAFKSKQQWGLLRRYASRNDSCTIHTPLVRLLRSLAERA